LRWPTRRYIVATKREEIEDPNSTFNSAADDEPLFIVRAQDATFVQTILAWLLLNPLVAQGHPRYGSEVAGLLTRNDLYIDFGAKRAEALKCLTEGTEWQLRPENENKVKQAD
jgi:hypothetical protein